jgi:hypothetical protein
MYTLEKSHHTIANLGLAYGFASKNTNVGMYTVQISSISSVVCQIGCRVRQPTQETFRPAIFLSCDFCSSAVAKLGSPLSNLSRQKVSTCRCEPIPQSRSLDIA